MSPGEITESVVCPVRGGAPTSILFYLMQFGVILPCSESSELLEIGPAAPFRFRSATAQEADFSLPDAMNMSPVASGRSTAPQRWTLALIGARAGFSYGVCGDDESDVVVSGARDAPSMC
jgi:hypothetical protein